MRCPELTFPQAHPACRIAPNNLNKFSHLLYQFNVGEHEDVPVFDGGKALYTSLALLALRSVC